MRRIALAIACIAVLPPAAAPAAPASVALTACEPEARAAEFEARMGEVGGAARMKMRFTLQARRPDRGWRRVAAPGFDRWTTADAGTTRYVFTRRVEALIGPAGYRALVRFHWVDESGRTVARASAYSRACRQDDHRPNLTLRALSVEGEDTYVVLVANTGRSESGPFELALTVAGQDLGPIAVASLEPHAERLVAVAGPACAPGSAVTATVDPLHAVDERSERDNQLTVQCA
jgi:hypothetical protein